jgi:hypothetical protein
MYDVGHLDTNEGAMRSRLLTLPWIGNKRGWSTRRKKEKESRDGKTQRSARST